MLEIIENTRKIISPYELDIYIPAKAFAIEYNGLVWHTEEHVGKDLHSKKSNLCKDKNIQSYPTWSFQIASSTGTTTEEFFPGEKTFAELGLKTGCALDETIK